MTFIERLRAHLERLPEPVAEPLVLAPYQAHLLRRLQGLEEEDASKAQRTYLEVVRGLESFVRQVQAGLLERGLAASDRPTDLEALTLAALDRRLGLCESPPSRVVDAALEKLLLDHALHVEFPLDVKRYAFETRLSRRREQEIAIARAGRIFLSLPGRDALTWLLALEMAQAQSDEDPFCLSMWVAKEILSTGEALIYHRKESSAEEPYASPVHYASLMRLYALGVLEPVYGRPDGEVYLEGYLLTPGGRAILEELTRDGEHRWAPLAAACIAEEQGMTLDELLPVALRLQRESAAQAGAREARLVAHEVRNALGPVRFALTRLLAVVADTEAQRQLARVEEGVTRLFRFVDDRLRMADVLDHSGESFGLDHAIRDLLSLETPPELALSAGDAEVRGDRHAVVVALAELVRNAHLANDPRSVRVRVTTERRNGHVTLLVDDDGTGVSSGARDRVFQRGVSLRGGSGEGLAIAKDVFERAMGGTIRCMESPLGGARFEMILPTATPIPRSFR